jgi:hypothetical protein
MKSSKTIVMYKNRYLGILFLVIIQLIVGFTHIFFGLALISGIFSFNSYSIAPTIYTVYTLVYGLLTAFFTYLIWKRKRLGWIGTVAISIFVILVDSLALFDLSNILSIPAPKFAAIGEIPFSILVLAYLLQNHVRLKYNI